jgi:hypothetical protein
MDNLEEYIRKNREYLDRYTPSSGIWKKIRKKLNNGKSSKGIWLSVAAIFIAVLASTTILFRSGNVYLNTKSEIRNEADYVKGNSHLKETEIYYNSLVNTLYQEASPLLTGNPEVGKELNYDISQLDSICKEIKKDLKDNVATQEVVEALIQNYRIKIHLLEDVLTTLKEDKNDQKKNKGYEL